MVVFSSKAIAAVDFSAACAPVAQEPFLVFAATKLGTRPCLLLEAAVARGGGRGEPGSEAIDCGPRGRSAAPMWSAAGLHGGSDVERVRALG